MISRFLIDYNNTGNLFCFTIMTENRDRLCNLLKTYSNDVRYLEDKETAGKKDKGKRKLEDGSIVLRCQYFGDKIPAMYSFKNSPSRFNLIQKAVIV